MKTMKNFAAQQLSKKQMNDVKGGRTYYCDVITVNGNKSTITIEASHPTSAIIEAGKEDNVKTVLDCK